MPVTVRDHSCLNDVFGTFRFLPRVLGTLEINISFFIYRMIGFDSVKSGFGYFSDILCRGKFQIVWIFLNVPVNNFVVEIAEIFDVIVIMLVQHPAVTVKFFFIGTGCQLQFQQFIEKFFEFNKMLDLAALISGELPPVFICKGYSKIVVTLP